MSSSVRAAVIVFVLACLSYIVGGVACSREPTPAETIRGAEVLLKIARYYTRDSGAEQ